MNELALFAGTGGGILGGKLLGWRTVCAVERDAYASQVLAQRQNDGILEAFPIWSDITTFDGKPWRGIVDVVSGGFPCQDISAAGKGAGIEGARSGMWKEMARIIGEVRPTYAFIENSPMLTTRGLDTIICDLAAIDYDAEGCSLSCEEVGGVHLRERAWILAANTNGEHGIGGGKSQQPSSISRKPWDKFQRGNYENDDTNNWRERIERGIEKQVLRFSPFPWGEDVRRIEDLRNRPDLPEPLFRGGGDDVAYWMDRLKAIGNGQVPRVAATAFELLRARLAAI